MGESIAPLWGRTIRGNLQADNFSSYLRVALQNSLLPSYLFSSSQIFRYFDGGVIMAKMRDKLIHWYFEIDEEIVWKVATEKLPTIKEKIDKIIEMV